MEITDKMVKSYCERMGYELLEIGNMAFSYIKPNGEKSALLKAAAAHNNRIHVDRANCPAVEEAKKGVV